MLVNTIDCYRDTYKKIRLLEIIAKENKMHDLAYLHVPTFRVYRNLTEEAMWRDAQAKDTESASIGTCWVEKYNELVSSYLIANLLCLLLHPIVGNIKDVKGADNMT